MRYRHGQRPRRYSAAAIGQIHRQPGFCRPIGRAVRTAAAIERVEPHARQQGVIALLAKEGVITAPAIDDVIALAAPEPVGPVLTAQVIVEIAALEILDRDEDIARGLAGVDPRRDQIGGDPGGCVPVGGPVDADAANKPVRAFTADERVAALLAVERVIAARP